MASPLKELTNTDEIKERQRKLVGKSRAAFEDNDIHRSLKLLKRAYELLPNEKLKRKLDRLKEYVTEDEEAEEGRKQKSAEPSKCEVAPGLPMKKEILDKLYAHQKEGLKWLWDLHEKDKGGILADDMGLGKTVQIVTFLSALYEAAKIRRVLIAMPVSVMLTWNKEFETWGSKKMTVLHFHEETKPQRLRHLRKIQRSGGVLLTTYGLLMTSYDDFSTREDGRDFEWDYFILDEGHKIKNKGNKTTKAAHGIPSKHRIILTGEEEIRTAIQNNLMELWSLFDFVHFGGLLGTQKSFKTHFETPILRSRQRDASMGERHYGAQMAESLKNRIAPFFLRRTKAQVTEKNKSVHDNTGEGNAKMPTLSRKNDLVVWLYLSEVQEKIYRDFLQLDVVKELLVQSNKRSPLMELTILKKICDHPRLLSTFQCVQLGLEHDGMVNLESEYAHQCAANMVESVDNEVLKMESGKVMFVAHLIDELKKQGHRALIFSQSRKMLNIIEKVLKVNNHRLLRLDGTITSLARRQEIIDRFTERPDRYSAFLLTTQVGGIGLTLTAADRVIIVDPSWNPATDNQAVDRAFRIGQDKNVVIYRLITCGTVEEKIYRRQIFKESITRQTTGIRNTDKDPYRYFTSQQLRELFSLTSPRYSETQRQLQELHGDHRVTDEQLDAHLAFLHSLDMFGLSDHDLMFSCEDDGPEEEIGQLGETLAKMTLYKDVAARRAMAEHQLNIESTISAQDKIIQAQLEKYQAAARKSAYMDFKRDQLSTTIGFIDARRSPLANSTFIEGKMQGPQRPFNWNSTFMDSRSQASSILEARQGPIPSTGVDSRWIPRSAGSIRETVSRINDERPEPIKKLPHVFAPSHDDTKRPMFNRPVDKSTTLRQILISDMNDQGKTARPPTETIVLSSDSENEATSPQASSKRHSDVERLTTTLKTLDVLADKRKSESHKYSNNEETSEKRSIEKFVVTNTMTLQSNVSDSSGGKEACSLTKSNQNEPDTSYQKKSENLADASEHASLSKRSERSMTTDDPADEFIEGLEAPPVSLSLNKSDDRTETIPKSNSLVQSSTRGETGRNSPGLQQSNGQSKNESISADLGNDPISRSFGQAKLSKASESSQRLDQSNSSSHVEEKRECVPQEDINSNSRRFDQSNEIKGSDSVSHGLDQSKLSKTSESYHRLDKSQEGKVADSSSKRLDQSDSRSISVTYENREESEHGSRFSDQSNESVPSDTSHNLENERGVGTSNLTFSSETEESVRELESVAHSEEKAKNVRNSFKYSSLKSPFEEDDIKAASENDDDDSIGEESPIMKKPNRFRRLVVEDSSDESEDEASGEEAESMSKVESYQIEQDDEALSMSEKQNVEQSPTSYSHTSVQGWEMKELDDEEMEERIQNPDIAKILSKSLASTPHTPARRKPILVENSSDFSEDSVAAQEISVTSKDESVDVNYVADSFEESL